jgi:hypothetical protein
VSDSPTPTATEGAATPAAQSAAKTPSGTPAAESPTPAVTTGADAPIVAREPEAEEDPTPQLVDEDGVALPQTEDKPRIDSPAFVAGGKRLFEAIVKDNAGLALPFFFPVEAYKQVKDIKKPERDWETLLVRSYRRDIHEYHKRLGRYRDQAKFLRIEVAENLAKWMKPGSEGNKVGYFRVLRSRIIYEDHEGRERELGVTSMISWRGEWYVVHLDGFS